MAYDIVRMRRPSRIDQAVYNRQVRPRRSVVEMGLGVRDVLRETEYAVREGSATIESGRRVLWVILVLVMVLVLIGLAQLVVSICGW